MYRKFGISISLLLAVSVVLALFSAPLGGLAAGRSEQRSGTYLTQESSAAAIVTAMTSEAAINKIDPVLREKMEARSTELVNIYVSVTEATDLSKYMDRIIMRPAVFGGIRNVYGQTTVNKLVKIANLPTVAAVVGVGELLEKPYDPEVDRTPLDLQSRLEELLANEVPYSETDKEEDSMSIQGWFDVLDGHKSADAWAKGYTGDGVILGILDDGVDFGHPDLQGTYAVVTDPSSPYYGWPMAFSMVSVYYFASEVDYQNLGAVGITQGWNGSRWSDTQTIEAAVEGPAGVYKIKYTPVGSTSNFSYIVPTTSLSGEYKIGTHHDRDLLALYNNRVAVLVVDENSAGVYDTVYVDLDNDKDFTDEKPVTKDSPEVYRDIDGDGYADLSGGLLVWISDGAHTPPTVDWLWGISCGDEVGTLKACPDQGDLLLFAGTLDANPVGSHGTLCASNAAGQGVIAGGLSAQPFAVPGMVVGAAPEVGIMDFGNHYYSGTDEDEFLVVALGYDGIPNSGDEVQIASNSYGNFTQMWGSWGYYGRLITALNTSIAPTSTWVFSSGNEGPGYGPQEGDSSPTTLQVGSSTQYGSTNWDSISSIDQIVYGDPNSFFAKGPNRDGTSGLDILANGGRGSGDANLNYALNGWTAWETWGGTSRSSPLAAGNLALVYDAYMEKYGEWPTWDIAKALFKSGATNSISAPFYQGAGVVNADRATDLAAGLYGVYATPTEWQVGDWEGENYLNFANVAWPGQTYTQTYTVYNPSLADITVDLSDGVMMKFGGYTTSFTTSSQSEESDFNFHTPDYLMEMDDSLIPADTELMVVRYAHPYDTFDPDYAFDGSPNSSWRFMVYNWTDVNEDGMLWEDRDANGVVNHMDDTAGGLDNDGFYRPLYSHPNTEIQPGEYVRMDYEFGGLAIPIMIRDPLARMADGYFFGFQHRLNDGTIDQTTIAIEVEFYKRADWGWLSLDESSLSVSGGDTAIFEAEIAVPIDAEPGAYEGVIYVEDPGDLTHSEHETVLPVVVNVIADLEDNASLSLGGEPRADTLYDNSNTYGYFNWYGGGWTGAGDWRHYFFNVDANDVANQNLLVHTSWDTGYPTDFNTFVLGPTYDCASNGEEPCAWYQPDPDVGQPDPLIFGPYTLQPIGQSEPFRSGATYPFWTSTGGPDDWLVVPFGMSGLHEIALHNVLFEADTMTTGVAVDVGTILKKVDIDPSVGEVVDDVLSSHGNSGEISYYFTPTLEMPDLTATLSGPLVTTTLGPFIVNIPDAGGSYDPWDSNNVWEPIEVIQAGTTELGIHLYTEPAQDPDLFLVYDVNENGVPDAGTDYVVSESGNSTGSDEEIIVSDPDIGQYLVVFHGYSIDPTDGVDMDWEWWTTAPAPVPSEEAEWFNEAVTVNQDIAGDPLSASVVMTFTSTVRSANLHFLLTGIPDGSNVDLYLSDDSGVIASATNAGNEDEHIMWSPEAGEYRLGEGKDYTIWVLGEGVPDELITPNLKVWSDEVNIWLSTTSPDVVVNAIDPNESVDVIVNYAVDNWLPEETIGARFVVGSSVIEGAFDEYIQITKSGKVRALYMPIITRH